jgi:cytochrome b involved in lipid metabolism
MIVMVKNMIDFTFLTEEQIFGSEKLDILKKYSNRCAITDFAVLLDHFYTTPFGGIDESEEKLKSGCWWTKDFNENEVAIVNNYGTEFVTILNNRLCGARPAFINSEIQAYNYRINPYNIKEITYGEYPQYIVSHYECLELERALNNGSILITGKTYGLNSYIEYLYKGKKYIRFVTNKDCLHNYMSNDRIIKSNNIYWIRVDGITWLFDEKTNIFLSKSILFSGINFNDSKDLKDFNESYIKRYLNNVFAKNIIPSIEYEKINDKVLMLKK